MDALQVDITKQISNKTFRTEIKSSILKITYEEESIIFSKNLALGLEITSKSCERPTKIIYFERLINFLNDKDSNCIYFKYDIITGVNVNTKLQITMCLKNLLFENHYDEYIIICSNLYIINDGYYSPGDNMYNKVITMHRIDHENKIFKDHQAQITELKQIITDQSKKIDEITELLKNQTSSI